MNTVVLVHGAWGGSWIWKAVARRLRAEGFEVYAPTLSGVADRSHIPPEVVDLNTHISDVANLLRFEDLNDVLLVGHSYGGMVTTGAADREIGRIGAMVYLDAFLPENGQSLWDVGGPQVAASHQAAAQAHDGGRTLPYHLRHQGETGAQPYTPQAVGTMSTPWISVREVQAWPHRHYVRCAQNPGPIFHRIFERLRADPAWTHETYDAGHNIPLTHPEVVADMIAAQARL
jgi:pimeloyl-ACP methyl ester carboxylesterase